MRAAIGLSFTLLLMRCAGGSGAVPAAAEARAAAACTKRLGARPSPRPALALPAAISAPQSRLIVEARLPLERLAGELEQNVARRLAEGSGVKLGPAGVLHYSVDRGAFSLSIAEGELIVEAPLSGRAEACSGRRCYASCEPRALARAVIPLWLRPDYRFGPSRVTLEFMRGCKVRALKGLLSVDVTPILKSAVAPRLERVRREIDGRLPDVRADVERAWRKLTSPRALPLGGCVVIDPVGLVQGPVQQSGAVAEARFALLARPELRSDCTSPPAVQLPPLRADPALPAEDSVTLGMEMPLASLARAFEAATPAAGELPPFHVDQAHIEAQAERIAAELELGGELCGSVVLAATPTFAGEEGVIELSAGSLAAGEGERVRAVGLDPAQLAEQLTRLPRVETPLSLPLLRLAPPALASLFSDPEFALSARVSSLRAAGAAAREQNLVAWVEARGSLLLEQKGSPPRPRLE